MSLRRGWSGIRIVFWLHTIIGVTAKPRPLPSLSPNGRQASGRQLASLGFHTGIGGPNPQQGFAPKFRIALSDPLLLEDVAIRFPELKIVIMHMGWPFYDHALYMLWTYENVYLDTAVVDWILGKELFNRMLREAVETVGSDRILFGSDQMVWPQMITPAIESIRDATFLSDQDKRNILSENARHLLKIAN